VRLAIFSDIHGNLEALDAVLAHPDMSGADRAICLGDVIGYGADPSDCLARVRQRTDKILLGNHESAVAHPEELEYFNGYARTALEWTRDQLSPEEIAFISALPYTFRESPDILCVHSAPCRPQEWTYIVGLDTARPELACFTETLCFVGHSHVPLAVEVEPGGASRLVDFPIRIQNGSRYLVNVGGVGQPRDRDPRAAFMLYDSDARTVSLRRVEYPIERAQEKIIAAGLPPFLAARLAAGR
jgi:diadenosine tetraphosphatase ApaH/serine/threonine PP2A family protein phosphatase